jgi:hypothetical protein
MKKLTVVLIICLCVGLVAVFATGSPVVQGNSANAASKGGNGGGGGSSAGKTQAATMTFRDYSTDQIKSDNGTGYDCEVQQGYPDQEILLSSYPKTKGVSRYLSFMELLAADTSCNSTLTVQNISPFHDTPTLAIIHGGDAPIGQDVARRAVLYMSSLGQFNYGYRNLSNAPGVHCSFEVMVHRYNANNWTISTDGSGELLTDSTLDSSWGLSSLQPVGNIVQLQNHANYFVGNYQMSFGITVYCKYCQ